MSEEQEKGLSRREFAQRVAMLSAGASLVPGSTMLPDAAGAEEAGQLPENLPKLTPQGVAESEARYQLILSRHGSMLKDEDKKTIRTQCFSAQPSLDRVRAYLLQNGDVPALFLKPIVEREKKATTAAGNSGSAPAAKKD